MKKIFLALLSAVWFLNGNAMERNHSRSSVPPFPDFEKAMDVHYSSPSPGRYEMFREEERELCYYCDRGFLNEKYSDLQKEIVNDFVELLNVFLRLERRLNFQRWTGRDAVARDYLVTHQDKIERLKLHKDFLVPFEDKVSKNVTKEIFCWLKKDKPIGDLYHIIESTQEWPNVYPNFTELTQV